MSLPKPNDKKSSNGLPILDGSFNVQSTQKQSPTIPTKSSGGLPVIDSSYNQFIEKKNGGSESVTTSLTQSESPSQSGLPERESPTSFLSNDIEQAQFFSTPEIPEFDPRSLSEPTTPQVQNNLMNEERITERQKILSEPDSLSSYAKDRINKIKSEIQTLQNVDLERFAEYGVTSVPGAPLTKTFKPGAEAIQQQIEEKKRYLNKFQSALSDQAAFVVGASEDLTTVDDAKLKSIGAKYLKTMNDTGIASDEEVLRTIDDIGANKTDIDRTSQNINYKLYKAGADVMAKYYNDISDKTFQEAQPKLQELNSLLQQKDTMKPGLDADLLQSSINDLIQDPQVKSYIDSERNAATYLKKSNDAINEFPQVKRQAMRQQLNDAFFNMTMAKQSASKDVGSLGMALGSWLFGEEATEGDIKTLAKATGIPEDRVNEIIGTDIKGWFGAAKDAGIRIPGALIGLAQSTDETIAKAVMGSKRFFNTENVEAENRLLSDRVQDYNLKAQKAKLFDDAGKLNFNPYSVFNMMGSGIGQTAVYAAPSLITGGLASSISGIEKVGKLVSMATTTGTGFVGSYEDAYKEAKQYTTDEDVARSYATKVGLVNGLSEIFLEPADVAKKLAIGSPRGKDAFSAFSKMYKDKGIGAAMAQGLKEFGKVVGTENIEELSALLGETKFKESELGVQTSPAEFINQAIETVVTTTLTTLPLGIGAGINANRDASGIRKQALFEVGNEPDLNRDKLRKLRDSGAIDEKRYNDLVSVVNTMSGIVANINQSETQTGKTLSYDKKANLAAQQFRIDLDNKRLKSSGVLEAEKPLIGADIKEATEIQRQELEDEIIPQETPTEAGVPEVSVNEKEQAAIEGLQNKDFANSPIKPYTDVIQNPDASIADKKEALKGLSDQLTAKGTEITVGEALGKEADLIYDLGYEPAQESEAIRAVTEGNISTTPLLDKFKERKRIEAQQFDESAAEKGIAIVRPSAVSTPNVVEKVDTSQQPSEPKSKISVIAPSQNKSPELISETSPEAIEVSQIIDQELAPNGVEGKDEVRNFFKKELAEDYDEELVDAAFNLYKKRIGEPVEAAPVAKRRNVESKTLAATPAPEVMAEETPIPEEEPIELTAKEKLASEKSLPSYRAKYPGATQEEYQTNRVSGTLKKDQIKAAASQKGAQEKAPVQETQLEPKGQKNKKEESKPKKKTPSTKKLTSIEEVENELRDLFAMDRIVGIPVGEKENTIEQYLEKAKSVLSQLYPDATITTYDTAEEYYDKEGRPVGSMGVFHPKENRLALNLELISKNGAANTVFHEVIHPIVEEAIVSKEGALDEAWNQLMELKDAPGMMSVFEHMLAYEGRSINVQRVEGITEFITQVAEGNIDVSDMPKSLATKIIELINEIFEKLGIDKRLSTANDLSVLSKAIKNAFDTADASSVATVLGNRSNVSGESMDALSGAEQDAAIKDLISRSEGIPQDKLKAAIKKYTGWSDEKVDSFFGEEEAPSGETGERKFGVRVAADKELEKPSRKQIKENLAYIKGVNAISAREAERRLNDIGEDEAYDVVVNDRDIAPATRVMLGQMLIKKFNKLAVDSTDPEEKEIYHEKTVNIADFVSEKLGTIPGQMVQALTLYSRLSPEANIIKAVKEKKKDSKHKKDKAERRATNIADKISKVNAETADEITSSKKISKAVDDAKKSVSEKAAEKIERARKRRQQIKDKYKSEKGTSLYSGVGLTKEGIEYVGNIAKTYIDEGVAELSIIIDNVLNDLKDLTSKSPNEEVIKNVNDIVFSQFQSRRDDVIAENLKDLEATVGRIVKEHYTVKESEKRSLVDKFVENAGLPQEEAKKLADEVSEEFDRIATRKKTAILDQEKKQFNQIKKILDTWNKTSAERLANDIIKYTNLGAFDRGDLIDMLAKKIGTGQLTPEEIKKIRELAERVEKAPEGSPKTKATEDLLAYQADLKGTSWAEVGQAIWYANVLSGVSTHLKNIISTFFNGAAYFATQSVRDPRSIPFLFKGGVSGAKRGFFEAIHTATTGETPIHVRAIDVPDVLERKNFYGGIFNPVTYLKYVSRMMKAEDVLQFQALKEMRATQLAYKEARKLGYKNSFSNSTWRKVDELLLNTKERIDEATKEAQAEGLTGSKLDRRVYELMELSRPIQMTEDAYGFAAKGTFNHDTEGTLGALNDLASRMLDFSVGGAKPLRFIVPFTRILTNVLNNAIDFSPLGLIRAARGVRGFKSFGKSIEDKYHVMTPDERADTLAKASLATAMTLGLYILSKMKGDDDEPFLEITGGGTGDYRKDAQLRQSGWQPYSVKIGDNYYSYALTPLAISLGLVGNINDHEKYSKGAEEEELYQKVTMAAWQWAKLATDMTWIGSTSSFMGALDASNPVAMEKAVSNNLKNTSKSFLIPNIYSQTAQEYQRLFNLPQKQTNNFYEQLIQDVPIARNSLNDKINALGDPIIRDTDLMISEKTVDPTLKLLMDKKAWVSPVNKNSFIVYDKEKKLERVGTDDEYYQFSKSRGKKVKDYIDKAVKGGVPFGADGRVTISDINIVQYKPIKDVTSSQFQSYIKSISGAATKAAKSELTLDKPKN